MTKTEVFWWDSPDSTDGVLGVKQNSRFCFFGAEGFSWSIIMSYNSHKLNAMCIIHSNMSIKKVILPSFCTK